MKILVLNQYSKYFMSMLEMTIRTICIKKNQIGTVLKKKKLCECSVGAFNLFL